MKAIVKFNLTNVVTREISKHEIEATASTIEHAVAQAMINVFAVRDALTFDEKVVISYYNIETRQ